MKSHQQFIQLNSLNASLIIDCQCKTPAIIYWGKLLSKQTSAEMLSLLATRQEAKCSLVIEAPISLSPLLGEGFTGSPGIEINNDDYAWSLGGKIVDIIKKDEYKVCFETVDDIRQIKVIHTLSLHHNTDVLNAYTELVNLSEQSLTVNWCATPTIPLPDQMNKIMSFEGRWSKEFQCHSLDLFLGSFVRENRKGKTSHDNFPGMVMHNSFTHEQAGECYGFHLGWSGNHKMRAELLPEGRSYVQLGELLMPGEVVLLPQQSYQSPILYAAYSDQGFSGLSHCFHQYVRRELLSPKLSQKARPIHYNTWEGIYFDHDIDTLKELANKVAILGAERFVLDDGWFKGRRGDFAGLGDWIVDKEIYPQGLSPLIDHVNQQGMEFGLWFEPEMVNPDSDLYRAHPDWVLSTVGNKQLNFRNQLVLDLTRSEVVDYLFHAIDDVLTEYPKIVYIKWDMNRDINHAGNAQGKPAIHQQTQALYQLIDRIKKQHSHVEIESCSSGGARLDYGVLAHTDRVWTSDSNDALDRLSIQRGCSFFFPSEVMGAHIGPKECHITGRVVSMEMRAAVAFFGHMGLEMDPRELTDEDCEQLSTIITLHKKHRQLLHTGELIRLNQDGDSINFGIINKDKSQALFAYNCINETKRTTPPKYRFSGLSAEKVYRLTLIWPIQLKEYSPSILSKIQGEKFSGESLMQLGMQLPVLFPQTSLIFELNET
jgi:alpha-galactosidase